MKVNVMLKDVGEGDNGAKAQVIRKYFVTRLRTKL
jgi:hypothetical protein